MLRNLIGGPEEVGGDYLCYSNDLTSLEGAPVEVGGDFDCMDNRLITLDCSSNINGKLYCSGNDDIDPNNTDFYGYASGGIDNSSVTRD